jgi:iron complex transport system ATP-binding protein
MPEILLECKGLRCGYPNRDVLSDIDLALESGTIVGILGPNGSGKSTLLKTLVGTLKPLGGQITALGHNLASSTPRERGSLIAFVPQEEGTEFGFTAREVVAMGRIPRSNGLFETKEDELAAESALGQADADHLADRLYRELSGGERQRVLIARALAQETRMLLLDEPSSHLDLAHQVHLIQVIRKFSQAGGAVLVALHDLNLAAALVDSAILLSEGKIVLQGKIGDVIASPLLDVVYQTELERVKTGGGRTIVLPTYRKEP